MDTRYPWLEPLLGHWQTLYSENRLHHALLLLAPEGMGRKNAMHLFAKVLLCQKPEGIQACGKCHSCQLFKAHTHPDFYVLASEGKNKQIGIDAVRKANQFAWKTSALGLRRVILIESAELLGEAAANALLKTLEEPPENCHFLLYSNAVDRLLPTIVSRCSKWTLKKPDETDALNWLNRELHRKQVSQKASLDILRLNSGAPISALNFIMENRLEQLDAILNAFSLFVGNKNADYRTSVKLCEDFFPYSLCWLSYFLLDLVKYQQGTDKHLVFSEKKKMLEDLCISLPQNKLFKQYYELNKLNRQLLQQPGLNKALLITDWFLSF